MLNTNILNTENTENKKEENKMLTFKYLKKGEAKVIMDNLNTDGAIKNNCICLNNTDTILLRTNGSVIYGEYKVGDKRIKFTHSPQYALPYIAKQDYKLYKSVILAEWKKAYTEEAKAKMREVRMLIHYIMQKKASNQSSDASSSVAPEQSLQAPEVINEEPTIQTQNESQNKIEEKKEVIEMNIMTVAHIIRRELKLEGHYHAQLKIAMSYAWKIKKGQITLEELLNIPAINETAAPTYNAVNEEVNSEVAVTEDKPVAEDKVEDKPKQVKQDTSDGVFTIYLDKLENGVAYFNKAKGNQKGFFFKFPARNMANMDKTFAKDYLAKVLGLLPENSIVYFYGDFTEMTYLNNPAIRSLADSKHIKLERGLYGVAPSGIA